MSEWRDVRVPATIRGYTDRPQGTVRARRSLGPPDRPVRPARSRLGSLRRQSCQTAVTLACPKSIKCEVNIVPCFRLLRQPRGCAAIRREHTTYGRIPRARVTRKSDRRRALGGFYGCYGTYQCVTKTAEHGPVRMNYSQDVADTTYLSAQNPL